MSGEHRPINKHIVKENKIKRQRKCGIYKKQLIKTATTTPAILANKIFSMWKWILGWNIMKDKLVMIAVK